MNVIKAKVISFFVYVLNPTLWLTISFVELSHNNRFAYVKMAGWLGLFGFALFPWGDGYERYKVFENAKYFDLHGIVVYGLQQGDIFFYLIAFLFQSLDIHYQYLQFIFVFFGYIFIFFLLRKHIDKYDKKNRIIIIFSLIMLVNITSLSNNIRYLFSTIIFLCGIVELEKRERTKATLWIVLAGLTHFYIFILLPIYLILSKASKLLTVSNVKVLLFVSIILMFVSPPILKEIAALLSSGDSLFARKVASYILGSDGVITKMVSSPIQIAFNLILQLPLLCLVVFYYNNCNLIGSRAKLFLLSFSFCLVIVYFYSTYSRISYFFLLYGFIVLVDSWDLIKSRKTYIVSFVLSSILLFTSQLVYFQRIIDRDNISYINDVSLCVLASPIFLFGKCTYSDDEIYSGNKNFRSLKAESIKRTMAVISD